MSITETKKIDIAHIDNSVDAVILSISDHLDWIEEDQHLMLLQEKINTYLVFIESGQIYENNLNYKEKQIVIRVLFKYKFTEEALIFLEQSRQIIEEAGFLFEWEYRSSLK